VGPAEFIPLAEASGLIVDLGRWVLDAACRAAAAWPAGPDGRAPGVTVNVSGRQLEDPALPGHVAAALAASGLAAGRLTLEITETVLMRDTAAALGTLGALKALGVRLAVDDFGTGYSSLRYLQQFPVDVLKIDRSFVEGVARGPQGAALARTIVALGQTLGLRTVAEGVETAEQRDALLAMGCALGQGYLFARPLDGAALLALLGGAPAGAPAGAEAAAALAGAAA
jgi:EAL domain-containing protein (putative c-di-GMP-specific phosphodiesterase class I)